MQAPPTLLQWWRHLAGALLSALSRAGLSLGAASALVLALCVAGSPAQAQSWQEECSDIEALGSLTLTPEGRQRAAELVRQGHPARAYLCVELGWSCAALWDAPGEGEDTSRCAGAESPEESRCTDPDAEGAWESFAGSLLDDADSAPRPWPRLGPACFDDPATCSGLPPLEPTPRLTAQPIPTLLERVVLPPQALPAGAPLEPITARPEGAGLGFAPGFIAGIDHPPRRAA